MEAKDLLVTPFVIALVLVAALLIRPRVTNPLTRIYFLPALGVKIVGAIALGLVYKFYYGYGDTINYFEHGSLYIYQAFLDNPIYGLKLLVARGEYDVEIYRYSSKIWHYSDQPSYFVVRVAGIFGIFTGHTYSAIAILFCLLSFTGAWAVYSVFQRIYPHLHLWLAITIFFIPTVFFWGSGLLKDTLAMAALGWLFYGFVSLFIFKEKPVISVILMLIGAYLLISIKVYILLCLLPALILWVALKYFNNLGNIVLRLMVAPFIIAVAVAFSFLLVREIGKSSARYNFETISYTAEASARWLAYVSEKEGGSGYSLGDFDYSPQGIVRKAPSAVWVTLFRPYLWEVKNAVMLLSAVESLGMLFFTFYALYATRGFGMLTAMRRRPEVAFCIVFSIVFALAVGFVSYNFGTLVRYKVPLIPFYLSGLVMAIDYVKSERKLSRLAFTENPF